MNNSKSVWVGLIVVVLIAIGGFLYLNNKIQVAESDGYGASGTRFPNGLSADTTSPTTGQVRGTTLTTTAGIVVDTTTLVVNSTNNNAGIGTSSPTTQGDLVIDGSATTTMVISSSGVSGAGGCIQIDNGNSTTTRAYINAARSAWVVEAGVCK